MILARSQLHRSARQMRLTRGQKSRKTEGGRRNKISLHLHGDQLSRQVSRLR